MEELEPREGLALMVAQDQLEPLAEKALLDLAVWMEGQVQLDVMVSLVRRDLLAQMGAMVELELLV
jgi:Flp pilus assembly secretin CpaC